MIIFSKPKHIPLVNLSFFRYISVGVVFLLLQIFACHYCKQEIISGITLRFYDLTLPLISALLVIYRSKALPILALFFLWALYFHPLTAIFTLSAQLLAALISQTFYYLSTGRRGAASFGRSELTARRITWLVCCNALLFTFLEHWLQPPSLSIATRHFFTQQTFINLQWLMNSCLTGIPFCYLLFRSLNKPGWCRLYLKHVKVLLVSGPGTLYLVIWFCLMLSITYFLITAYDNALIYTEYSLLWLLPMMLWGAVCIGHSVISPLWVMMLMLLSSYTNNYIISADEKSYLHSVALVSSMIFIFSLTIVLTGVLVNRNRSYLSRLKQLFRSEPNTGLPNFQALKMDMRKYSTECLCYLRCTELNKLEQVHGTEFRFEFVKALCAHVNDIIRDTGTIYYTPGQGLIIRFNAIPDILALYKMFNAFRFNWNGFELGIPCGVASTTEKVHLQNLFQAVKLLNAQSYISLLQGQPLLLSSYSPGDYMVSEAVLRHELQKAIDSQSFMLMAQPIISTCGQMRYHEILIRVKTINNKMIFPDTILPIAKEAGLLSSLDITVIEQTFRFMHSIRHSDSTSHFSINLMPDSLNKTDFIDNVCALFRKYNITPQRIIFEIIESEIINNANVIESLKALRELGSKIAIDDFGTGSSSYSRLRMLEADILKIDGSFIRNILDDEFSRSSVRSFREVAKIKNMEVVAEFVENKEIEKILIDMGIDWLQGYYIGKPAPVENLVSVTQRAVKMERANLLLEQAVQPTGQYDE